MSIFYEQKTKAPFHEVELFLSLRESKAARNSMDEAYQNLSVLHVLPVAI